MELNELPIKHYHGSLGVLIVELYIRQQPNQRSALREDMPNKTHSNSCTSTKFNMRGRNSLLQHMHVSDIPWSTPASKVNTVFGCMLKVRNYGIIKICYQIRSNSTIVCPSVGYPGQLQYDGFALSNVTTICNLCAI